MPVTVYSDVIVPDRIIRMGASGKNARVNNRTQNRGGYSQVGIVRNRTQREYTLGLALMSPDDWATIEGLHEITDGGAYGMLLHDPKDSICSTGLLQGVLSGLAAGTMGVGHGLPSYRMFQRKSAAGTSRTYDRRVTRPQSPSVLTRNGSPVTIGVGAGNAAINYDTGTATWIADATRNVTAITVGATTQVTLATALPAVAVGGRLYLTGLTGADAALLNALSHPVTAITGGGANVYTLGTNTAGKTITTGSGIGYQYPQPTDALAWTGPFYVPVQFKDDYIDWDIVRGGPHDRRLVAGPAVTLVEILEP